MEYFRKYIQLTRELASDQIAEGISETVNRIVPENISNFDFISHRSGLLLGNVQSGKTGRMLGVVAAAADRDFEVFVVLTTDNTHLQEQTFKRALKFLDDTFCVCGEQDDARFLMNEMRRPVVIVLKKNTNILKSWKNHLISSKFLAGRPIFIIDDEGDAASLNTKINRSDVSTINRRISEIRKLGNSSFYLQVTATPQSLFLQEKKSGHYPEFTCYFPPGQGYLGGDFFYGAADPENAGQAVSPARITDEDELREIRTEGGNIPDGMHRAIASFLMSAAHIFITESGKSCNFLIHPSVSISDHETVAGRIGEALNRFLGGLGNNSRLRKDLKEAWMDLRETKRNISDFEKCYKFVSGLLENGKIKVSIMNSKAKGEAVDFSSGANIVVGGNSLGRGVTFPNLQTTYYCRRAKQPQADTFWQHCRAFGYDRDPGLARIFLPASLFRLFSELNEANTAIIEYLTHNGPEGLRLVYPKNIRPTRPNVVNKDKLNIIVGGVNYFPNDPSDASTEELDLILDSYSDDSEHETADIDTVKNIISKCEAEDWPSLTYIRCIESLDLSDAILLVRRRRQITKGTGTLLSPDDRKLGNSFDGRLVLTMYRVDGDRKKKWDGKPLWIPNIKFPKWKFIYGMEK